MQPSWLLARNQLGTRRLRSAFLTATVALASSLIVAVSCSIASAQRSVDDQLSNYVGRTSARILHAGRGRFPRALLDTVRGWPEVALATGRIAGSITVRGSGGKDAKSIVADGVGIELDLERSFRELPLRTGTFPTHDTEVLIDPLAASWLEIGPGDELVATGRDERSFRVTGIIERPEIGPPFQRPKVYMSRGHVDALLRDADELSRIAIILKEEIDPDAFCAERGPSLPTEILLEPATLVRAGFDRRLEATKIGLTIAALLAFICSSFIIVTGLTSGVTERERVLGLLRAIGAGRRQLFAAQMWTGLFYGVAGAAIGIPLGIALSAVLVTIFKAYLPAGLTIHGLGVTLAAIGAIASGLVGSLIPAVLAARVTPMQAMTVIARPVRRSSIVLCLVIALVAIGIHLLLFATDDPEQRYWRYVYAGLPSLLIGWFMLGVPAIVIATRVGGPALSAIFRLPAGLLVGSLNATPFRHGFTAGALMVGMALLVDVWAAGASIQRDWIDMIRFADAFTFKLGPGIPPDEQAAIESLDFIDAVSPIVVLPVQIIDRQVFGLKGLTPRKVSCVGFDTARFASMNALEWQQGDPETAKQRLLDGTGMVVADRFLVAKQIGVGDSLTLQAGRIAKTFEIVGVITSPGLDIVTQSTGIGDAYGDYAVSSVFLDRRVISAVFGNNDVNYLQLDLNETIDDTEAARRIREVAPGVLFFSGRAIVKSVREVYNATLAIQSTVALGALLLAALAVANILAASAQGRRYEFGVLRALGAQRPVVLRLVVAEATTLALTGAALGTACGFMLARVDTIMLRDLAGLPVRVTIPVAAIAIGWSVQLIVTLGVSVPGMVGVLRATPSEMVAGGRNE